MAAVIAMIAGVLAIMPAALMVFFGEMFSWLHSGQGGVLIDRGWADEALCVVLGCGAVAFAKPGRLPAFGILVASSVAMMTNPLMILQMAVAFVAGVLILVATPAPVAPQVP